MPRQRIEGTWELIFPTPAATLRRDDAFSRDALSRDGRLAAGLLIDAVSAAAAAAILPPIGFPIRCLALPHDVDYIT